MSFESYIIQFSLTCLIFFLIIIYLLYHAFKGTWF